MNNNVSSPLKGASRRSTTLVKQVPFRFSIHVKQHDNIGMASSWFAHSFLRCFLKGPTSSQSKDELGHLFLPFCQKLPAEYNQKLAGCCPPRAVLRKHGRGNLVRARPCRGPVKKMQPPEAVKLDRMLLDAALIWGNV